MKEITSLKSTLTAGGADEILTGLYGVSGDALTPYRLRLCAAADSFAQMFGKTEAALFSVSGRTEIGGNHTDHQNGRVLAAAVSLDVIAAAAPNGTNIIRVQSEGYPLDEIDLSNLNPLESEKNTAAALIRGVAARFAQLGYQIGGFDAYTTSNVLKGSGLSSSAAFEVLLGNIINAFFADGKETDVSIAQIGQYAENVYFGKPCGLMDQMAASVGGVVQIDFADPEKPDIARIAFDPAKAGYALCIIDSGADHADLTDAYAAIPQEMCAVAKALGKERLRFVDEAAFYENLPRLRKECGDRAVLRAIHFFGDHARVLREADALRNGDIDAFLDELTASGKSSFCYLQNVYDNRNPQEQAVSLVLALCEQMLGGKGGFRVHGGGFAGTVQAFVPLDMLDMFKTKMEAVTGTGSCHVLRLRALGGTKII